MSISAIILTYNEELHIERCITSVLPVVDHIYVIDSYSTDSTLEILSKFENVTVIKNKFVNHSVQVNFALDNIEFKTDWILRVDADEYLDCELASWLNASLDTFDSKINGVCLNRRIKFLGKVLKYGDMDSYWVLRLWKNGSARCEARWMDEHMVLSDGYLTKAKGTLIDENLNTLGWWCHKHVDYSTKEAIEVLLSHKDDSKQVLNKSVGSDTARVRILKKTYNKFPLFVRPLIYFLYRYLFKLGFLDGRSGFIWNFLQSLWYRMLVDAKVYELKRAAKLEGVSVESVIRSKYGYEV